MADRYALVVDATNSNIKEIPAADRLVADNLLLSGTTPTLTIGDAGAEDTKIVFDGAAQDFYIGLDDTADDLVIGLGSAVGTTPAISIDENQDIVANQEFRAVSYNDTYVSVASGASPAINCETGNYFKHVLDQNATFTFSNPPASGTGYSFVLHLIQDSTARTVTWPGSVDWAAATAPTISAGNGDDDFFVFATSDGGTIWYGFTAGQAMA
tara:strand:- start:95 stop:730 length:636 start_codon:yes stop_codon:yes gene_type:complete